MFGLSAAVRVYLAKEPADMRKSFDGLSALVAGALAIDPLSGHLFVFVNKRRDRIKILYWDRDGLAVWAKRLERGTYRLPDATAGRVEMTTAELAALAGRHRPEHRPTATPLLAAGYTTSKFGEICANKRAHIYVVRGMITPADPLPDDIETAHRLIRELLETLRQQTHLNDKLQHQLEQLLRRLYGKKSEKLDPTQLLLFAQEILEGRQPEPTPTRARARSPAPAGGRTAREGPRPQALAGEPAPQAGRARRPARTTPLPRLRHRARRASARRSASSSNTSPRR